MVTAWLRTVTAWLRTITAWLRTVTGRVAGRGAHDRLRRRQSTAQRPAEAPPRLLPLRLRLRPLLARGLGRSATAEAQLPAGAPRPEAARGERETEPGARPCAGGGRSTGRRGTRYCSCQAQAQAQGQRAVVRVVGVELADTA